LFEFFRKEENMRSFVFRKHVALFVALVFVLTSIPMSPVFAVDPSITFDPEPTFVSGDTSDSGKSVGVTVELVTSDTISTGTAIRLVLSGSEASKFSLSNGASNGTDIIVTTGAIVGSDNTVTASAIINVASNTPLAADDSAQIVAKTSDGTTTLATSTVIPISPTYAVTVASNIGGSVAVTPDVVAPGALYVEGTGITITAHADSGYVFGGWNSADIEINVDASNPATFTFSMPAQNVTITATFVRTYSVGVAAGTGGTIDDVQGIGAYPANTPVTIKATVTTDDGYVLDGWTAADVIITVDATDPTMFTFAMPAQNITIMASFHKLPVETIPEAPPEGSTVIEPDVEVEAPVEEVDGKSVATVDKGEADSAVEDELAAITDKVEDPDNSTKSGTITITVTTDEPADQINVPLSVEVFESVAEAVNDGIVEGMTIESDVATVVMSSAALGAISSAIAALTDEANTTPETVEIVLDSAPAEKLEALPPDSAAATLLANVDDDASLVKAVTVFDISVLIDDEEVPITVNGSQAFKIILPYSAVDSSNNVTVDYIDENGNVSQYGLSGISYDKDNGLVTFYTTHLSLYAVVESTPPPSGGGGGGGTVPVVPAEEEPEDEEATTGGGSAGSWADNPFSDVSSADWFYADVEYAVKNGLFNGTSADAFSPNASMTRGMIVTVLGRLADADISAYTDSDFSDVESGQYYTAYVEWAKDNGIVNGVGDNLFAPNANVSRQDFAVLLMRYADFAQKQFPSTRQFSVFSDDADIADYAKNAIQTLYNGGIINGVGGDAINPKGPATRAEVAAMLHRFIEAAQ
jgi:hypothetical protein